MTRVVRSTVNHYDSGYEATNVEEVAHAFSNAKKEDAAVYAAPISTSSTFGTSSTITVAQLLDMVKEIYPNQASEDVANTLNYKRGYSVERCTIFGGSFR